MSEQTVKANQPAERWQHKAQSGAQRNRGRFCRRCNIKEEGTYHEDIRFIYDDANDRLKHYRFGFHTAKNGDLETFVGCDYLDFAPGNDGVRFNDVWSGRNQGNPQWGPACGTQDPARNQRRREDYAEPLNGIQILPTVNTNDDTLNIFFGRIRAGR